MKHDDDFLNVCIMLSEIIVIVLFRIGMPVYLMQ